MASPRSVSVCLMLYLACGSAVAGSENSGEMIYSFFGSSRMRFLSRDRAFCSEFSYCEVLFEGLYRYTYMRCVIFRYMTLVHVGLSPAAVTFSFCCCLLSVILRCCILGWVRRTVLSTGTRFFCRCYTKVKFGWLRGKIRHFRIPWSCQMGVFV